MVVVGSGAMAVRMSPDAGVDLLINAISTIFALGILIFSFGPISGAHFNPVVSLFEWVQRRLSFSQLIAFVIAQCVGGICGAMIANLMYSHPAYFPSHHLRSGSGIWLGEVVATAGLLMFIQMLRKETAKFAALLISAWIGSAYFFTSSTSFANPAVTLARSFTDTFSGIAPRSIGGFVVAQLIGAALGTLLGNIFRASKNSEAT